MADNSTVSSVLDRITAKLEAIFSRSSTIATEVTELEKTQLYIQAYLELVDKDDESLWEFTTDLANTLTKITKEYDNTVAQLKRVSDEMASINANRTESQTMVLNCNVKISELQATLNAAEKRYAELKKEYDAIDARVVSFDATTTDIANSFSASEKKMRELRAAIYGTIDATSKKRRRVTDEVEKLSKSLEVIAGEQDRLRNKAVQLYNQRNQGLNLLQNTVGASSITGTGPSGLAIQPLIPERVPLPVSLDSSSLTNPFLTSNSDPMNVDTETDTAATSTVQRSNRFNNNSPMMNGDAMDLDTDTDTVATPTVQRSNRFGNAPRTSTSLTQSTLPMDVDTNSDANSTEIVPALDLIDGNDSIAKRVQNAPRNLGVSKSKKKGGSRRRKSSGVKRKSSVRRRKSSVRRRKSGRRM